LRERDLRHTRERDSRHSREGGKSPAVDAYTTVQKEGRGTREIESKV